MSAAAIQNALESLAEIRTKALALHRDGDAPRPSADATLIALAVLVAAEEICEELSNLPHEPIEIAGVDELRDSVAKIAFRTGSGDRS